MLTSPDRLATCLDRNPDARLRLVCFPSAGGGAWAYSTWARELPADVRRDVEVWALSFPGRRAGSPERALHELAPLVDTVRNGLLQHLDTPYVFFGHSMGALVAFELVRTLRAADEAPPVHLIVSAHRAPHLPDRHYAVHDLPDAEIVAKLRRLGGTPDVVLENAELMEMMLPALRADLAVCETYAYSEDEPLSCPITAFGGTKDREVSSVELAEWHRHTRGAFEQRMFPGGHFFLDTARPLVLRVLAQELRHALLSSSRR
jgi:medium-chain acyl-[acyl-carrier-protein] hydrolase